jgi:cytochrome c553
MTHETIEELTERRNLLREIAELSAKVPDEDEMQALAEHVSNLAAVTNLEAPDEDDMEALADHIGNLRALTVLEAPSEDEMAALAQHISNLRATA